MKPATPLSRRRAAGFSLTELLIVIGIIVLLVSILIPVVSKVRIAAKTTETQALLQKINNAITNYFHDYQAYPGMNPNSAFHPNTPAKPYRVVPGMTQTEDLVLCLLGSLTFSRNPPTAIPDHVAFSWKELGKGPL